MSNPSAKLTQGQKISLLAAIPLIAVAVVLYLNFARPLGTTGYPAPQAVFKTLEGERLTTADLRGRVVLVNFWATSCEPCIREMPAMIATHNRFHAQGLETVAVAMAYDPPNLVVDYSRRTKLPFKVALDVDGAVARAFRGVQFAPVTFVIGRKGEVEGYYLGMPDFAKLHALLERELAKPVG